MAIHIGTRTRNCTATAPRAVMLIGVGYLVDENERTEKKRNRQYNFIGCEIIVIWREKVESALESRRCESVRNGKDWWWVEE